MTPVESPIYHFPLGIPAFEDHASFRLSEPAELAPLVLLESASPEGPRFVCLPVEVLEPGYELDLTPAETQALDATAANSSDLRLLAILTFPPDQPPTANLLAPVVLNAARGRGVQSVQAASQYPVARPVRSQPRGGEC